MTPAKGETALDERAPSAAIRSISDVRASRAAMEADIRASLLAAAARVLTEEGPAALTVRRVAEAVNASTKLIYTHFGGKDGLLEALYLHSFASLTQAFQLHQGEPDPHRRFRLMIDTYRSFALREPALYNVMFGDLGRAWEAPAESRRKAWTSFETLRQTVQDCLPPARAADATRVTYLLWSAAHGVVSVEMRGLLGGSVQGDELFQMAVDAVCLAHGLAEGSTS